MRRSGIPFLLVLALANVALAATLAAVTADANALLTEYQSLETRVDNCPGGTCQGAHDLLVSRRDDRRHRRPQRGPGLYDGELGRRLGAREAPADSELEP